MNVEIATPMAAFAAGLATSLHCAGMCGPLACALKVPPMTYHVGRLISYAALGAASGWVGQPIMAHIAGPAGKAAPWLLAAVLLMLGLGLEKRLPQPRWLAALLFRVRVRQSLGVFTPLLPCGPLWMMAGVAVTCGSAFSGALLLVSFSAGTIPLFWLLQSQALRLQHRLPTFALRWSQRGIALTSALILLWRATFSLTQNCCH